LSTIIAAVEEHNVQCTKTSHYL